ncbi:hypothetical protein ACLBO2_27845, partial [Klebsiella pneumoniae]
CNGLPPPLSTALAPISLQGILGSLGGLQTAIQEEWKNQEADFQQFGKDVCSRVVSLEDSRKALVGSLK